MFCFLRKGRDMAKKHKSNHRFSIPVNLAAKELCTNPQYRKKVMKNKKDYNRQAFKKVERLNLF